VRDDFRAFFRQFDHACLSLSPLFLKGSCEEVRIAGDEAAVGEQDVLGRAYVKSNGVIVVEAAGDVRGRSLRRELFSGYSVLL
jgi:hypothetical protein